MLQNCRNAQKRCFAAARLSQPPTDFFSPSHSSLPFVKQCESLLSIAARFRIECISRFALTLCDCRFRGGVVVVGRPFFILLKTVSSVVTVYESVERNFSWETQISLVSCVEFIRCDTCQRDFHRFPDFVLFFKPQNG